MMNELTKLLPHYFSGIVVRGYGRGGKELNCPTANVDTQVPPGMQEGVYYGLARIDQGEIRDMVMSIGTNPHYNNEKLTVEIHLLASLDKDFYGSRVDGLILGFIRKMLKFDSKEALVAEIQNDITIAKYKLKDIDREGLIRQHFNSKL